MRICLFHGYELIGSGSNEFNRYCAYNLLQLGHEVHLVCREQNPEQISFCSEAHSWHVASDSTVEWAVIHSRESKTGPSCYIHRIGSWPVYPVFLEDKTRKSQKSFVNLTDDEIEQYRHNTELQLKRIVETYKMDVMLVNHVIYNPVIASPVCEQFGIPFAIIPHGSSIEYVIRKDERYKTLALKPLLKSNSIIVGSEEMKQRLLTLYPEFEDELKKKFTRIFIGVDTKLFHPIKFEEREQSISSVIRELDNSEEQSEVQKTVSGKKFCILEDIFETVQHKDAGDINKPDPDLAAKLGEIPWKSGKIIIFIGALISAKGMHSLIAAFAGVIEKHPDAHLLIVGNGFFRGPIEAIIQCISDGNLELLKEIAKVGYDIDKSGLCGPFQDLIAYLEDPKNIETIKKHGRSFQKNVHCLGRINHSMLNRIFPCADLAVFPSSVSEAYSLVLLESLASGVHFMATNQAGNKSLIDELSVTLGTEMTDKMRVPVDDGERIAGTTELICSCLDSIAQLRETKLALRNVAEEKYDWKFTALQLEHACKMIMRNFPS